MELVCDLNQLRSSLERVSRVTVSHAELEALRHIGLKVDNNIVTLTGVSSGVFAYEALAIKTPLIPCPLSASLSGKLLLSVVENLPGQTCRMTFREKKLIVSSGRTRHQLHLSEYTDVVDIVWPDDSLFTPFDARKLLNILKSGIKVCGKEQENSRPLNSVIQFSPDCITATDSCTLLYSDNDILPISQPYSLAISAASRLAASLQTCLQHGHTEGLCYQWQGRLFLTVGTFRVVVMEVAIPFTDIKSSIGFSSTCEFVVDNAEFKRCLQQVAAGAGGNEQKRAQFVIGEEGIWVVSEFKTGTAETFLERQIAIGEPMTLYFDLDRLLKALDGLGESVIVSLMSPEKPIRLKDIDHEYYVVPQRF